MKKCKEEDIWKSSVMTIRDLEGRDCLQHSTKF